MIKLYNKKIKIKTNGRITKKNTHTNNNDGNKE